MWAIFQQVAEGVWSASWRASLLVGLVLATQLVFGRWLTAKWRHALWFVVVARLALPVGPGSSWSVFNLFVAKPRVTAVAPPEVRFENLDWVGPQNFFPTGVDSISPSPVRAASLPAVATARSR